MPDPKPQAKYNCTQTELYAICNIGWGSYIENVADFTAHNTQYDGAFGTAAVGEVTAAQALPDEQARGAITESLRIDLTEAAETAINEWKKLRSYIKKSYSEAQVKPNEEAAGYAYYATATNYDWEDLKQMLISGKNFLTANNATLTAGGMPPGFVAAYDAAQTAFDGLYADFKDAEQDEEEATNLKMDANNAIFDKLTSMFEDGQLIYESDPGKRDRFIFVKVKALVTPPGGGGGGEVPDTTLEISGKVTASGTGLPLSGAQVVIFLDNPEENANTLTDVNGDYEFLFEDLPAGLSGNMSHTVSTPGYQSLVQNIPVSVGNSYTVDAVLLPFPPPPP